MPTPAISIPELTEKNKINFWRKVDRNGPTMPHMDTPCWTWTAGKNHYGYGGFSIGGHKISSHRVAFVLGGGVFSEDKTHVCHHCDNRACMRFDHLYAGSHKDNMEDRERKGRNKIEVAQAFLSAHPELLASGLRNGAHTKPECRPRGERNGMAILTVEKVLEIRTRYTAGGITLKQLASEYGVNFTSIHFIITRRTWKHIPVF